MRRLLILAVLASIMVGLSFYEVSSASSVEPKTLAVFGFVLLAAYLIGELVAGIGLPRVTGYLVTGVVFGPQVANFFSSEVVKELSLMNSLAVGLIALTAGGELQVKQLSKNIWAILKIIGAQAVIILPLIVAIMVFAGTELVDWSSRGGTPDTTFLAAIGLMLGALAVGNSPAVSVAIVNETGSKGLFTAMNLGVTIVKDLVVVVLFALMTAVAISLMPGASGSMSDAIIHLAVEIGSSIVVGLIIGGIVVAWLKWVNAENMLFIVGLVFLGMYVGDELHLEKILVFIVAGFVVENGPKLGGNDDANWGHDMIHTIERVSPPVYVVFFAVAGAGLDLTAISEVIVIALVIVGARAIAMWTATNLGARFARLGPLFQRKLGLGFFSQAGVTLGLTIIGASKLDAIPTESGVLIGTDIFVPIIMGIVAINLMVGPVFLKISLTAAGETAVQRGEDPTVHDTHGHGHDHDHDDDPVDAEAPRHDAARNQAPIALPGDAEQLQVETIPSLSITTLTEFPEPAIDTGLDIELGHVRTALLAAIDEFDQEFMAERCFRSQLVIEDLQHTAAQVMADLQSRVATDRDPDALRHWIRLARETLAEQFYERLARERELHLDEHDAPSAFARLLDRTNSIPNDALRALGVDESDDLYATSDSDGVYIKARKSLSQKRVAWTKSTRQRVVPVKQLVEFYVAGPMPYELVPIANVAGYQRFFFWRKLNVASRYFDAEFCKILRALGDPILLDPPKPSMLPHEAPPVAEDLVDPQEVAAAARRAPDDIERLRVEMQDELSRIHIDLGAYSEEAVGRLTSLFASHFQELSTAAESAGTYLLPGRRINTSKIYDRNRDGLEEIGVALNRWHVTAIGFSGRLLAALDIIDLQHVAIGRVAEAEIEFANALLNDLRPVAKNVADRIGLALAEIEEIFDAEELNASKALLRLEAIRERLGEYIALSAIERLESLRDRGRFLELLEPFAENLSNDCMSMTHTVEVIDSPEATYDETVTPAEPTLHTLELRELARELLVGEALVKLGDVNAIMSRTVDHTISDLSDAQRVITFNLDAAVTEIANIRQSQETDDGVALAREFAAGGLRRTHGHVVEILASIDRAEQQVAGMLRHEIHQQIKRLREMAVESNIGQIRSYLSQRIFDDRRAAAVTGVRGVFGRASSQVEHLYRRGIEPTARYVRGRVRHRLGIEDPPSDSVVSYTDEASFAATENSDVPVTYRRLFMPAPVEIDEFFVGREPEVDRLRRAFERFQAGRPSNVLVVGEGGSGKSSFIDIAMRRLQPDLPIDRMSFSHNFQSERQLAAQLGELFGHRARNIDRLRARLRNDKERRVIVIEGLHNFYLRTLDGFRALQRFILLVSETSNTYFWVVSSDADTVAYVENLVPIDLFTETIRLPNFTQSELRRVIEARHNVSGYELDFVNDRTDDNEDAIALFGEPSREQREQAFFHALSTHSAGNPTVALFYWLRALEKVEDEESKICVAPVRPLDLRFIGDMRATKLLALGLIISHGGLTLPEFASVFRTGEGSAQAMLTGLVQQNLLYVELSRLSTYRVNPVLHRAIADYLRANNML